MAINIYIYTSSFISKIFLSFQKYNFSTSKKIVVFNIFICYTLQQYFIGDFVMLELSSLSRFRFFNLDRVQEILETNSKAVILICGASSSGKSYVADLLKQTLNDANLKSITISTDSYNKGISGIICDKANSLYFKNNLQNIEKIKEIVKNCIINTDFSEKFCKNDLNLIKSKTKQLFSKTEQELFLRALKLEFDKINFDEPSVYDLTKVASDINTLISNGSIIEKKYSKVISEQIPTQNSICGKDFDVIIVEGIYALENDITNNIPNEITVMNFIEGNSKSLFLRRVIRDAKTTSADNCFTISNYFKFIVPSYINQILPNKQKADIVFKNDMTFSEIRSGDLYTTKQKLKVTNSEILSEILSNGKIISREKQRDIYFCSTTENVTEENLLRLRTIYNENEKAYLPTSLVHKGAIKNRKDGKIVRPINILIKEGDFYKIFKDENDFVKNMEFAQFKIEREVYKTRTRVIYKGQTLTIDDIKNEGIFIEYSDNISHEFLNTLKSSPKSKTSKNQEKTSKNNEKIGF